MDMIKKNLKNGFQNREKIELLFLSSKSRRVLSRIGKNYHVINHYQTDSSQIMNSKTGITPNNFFHDSFFYRQTSTETRFSVGD